MTPEVCMQFLVWSYYYHDVVPEAGVSYGESGKFVEADVRRLDGLKDMALKCYEAESVRRVCEQLRMAKMRGEACPWRQEELDEMFGREV